MTKIKFKGTPKDDSYITNNKFFEDFLNPALKKAYKNPEIYQMFFATCIEIPLEEEPTTISPLPELKEEPTTAEAEKTEKMFAKSTSIAELRSEMLKALKRLKGFMETE